MPLRALVRPEKVEKGAKVTVGAFDQLKAAWEEYDEWTEDYAWQEGESAYILDLDEADGTVLLKFVDDAPEIKKEEEQKNHQQQEHQNEHQNEQEYQQPQQQPQQKKQHYQQPQQKKQG